MAPSILAADFARLGEQVEEVMDAGARVIHVDVMDGHFVPPISIGALIVDALRDLVHDRGGVLDVHLMVERPERRIDEFAAAGADTLIVHWEATPHVHYALQAVRAAGLDAGLALNPATPADVVAGLTDEVDHVLCMTVNPGWGGQPYITSSTAKVARLRELLGPDTPIEVDGGIDAAAAEATREVGATLFVAGSSIFGSGDPAVAYTEIATAVGRRLGPAALELRVGPAQLATRDRAENRRIHGHMHVRVEDAAVGVAEGPALRSGEDDGSGPIRAHDAHPLRAVGGGRRVHVRVLQVDHDLGQAPVGGLHPDAVAAAPSSEPPPAAAITTSAHGDGEQHGQRDQPGAGGGLHAARMVSGG